MAVLFAASSEGRLAFVQAIVAFEATPDYAKHAFAAADGRSEPSAEICAPLSDGYAQFESAHQKFAHLCSALLLVLLVLMWLLELH